MKSLHRKRTEKIRENTLDKKQIYKFFFVKSLHRKRSNKKELKKFAMSIRQRQLNYTDYILEDLDHICLEIGPSRFEMKSIGSFWATGNKKRITTWKLGNRCVSLTEKFNFGVLVEEIEKTNLKSEEELQTFKDEWNHNGMDTFSVGMLRVFGDNFFEFISFNEEDHPFRKFTI